jgi:hypothetical protein
MKKSILLIITILVVYATACNQAGANASAALSNPQPASTTEEMKPAFVTDNAFNAYWFAGKAELCSYDYTINRYDETRTGYCVFIFVTEDLSKSKQVKLDNAAQAGTDRVTVLKLNALQRFQTGIYDYSLMNSLFTPIDINNFPHSLKTTTTVQDWCGHVFTQMNLKGNKYHVKSFSYFETEGDKESDTEGGAMLEDEIFTRLRINPESLPNKNIKIVPNLTYTRLRHKPIEAAKASIEIKDETAGVKSCIVNYPDIKRRLVVSFEGVSPYKILGFTEFDGEKIMSEAKLKKSMMSDYWAKHDLKSDPLRKELGL